LSAGVASAARISHRFVVANGLRFHVAECGAGRRLALCLHGFPELWMSWRHQMPMLAELGYRVWAPDLRGYGGTDRPSRLQDYDLELLMTDVAALIDAAGARTTVLIGHDWGGIIAWYVAMRRLRPLQRLVIMNAPHPGAAASVFRSWKQLWRSWYAFFFQIPGLPERLLSAGGGKRIGRAIQRTACHPERFPDEVLAAYSEAASTPEALRAMLNYYRALVRSKGAKRQRKLGSPRIDTPTLMLWGEEDVALTRAASLVGEQYVSDLTVRRLPGVSHWVQQDDPETVNAMLAAWLRGESVPGAQG
jgi:pimeloyl-ACP methyl ester carboxylesterase